MCAYLGVLERVGVTSDGGRELILSLNSYLFMDLLRSILLYKNTFYSAAIGSIPDYLKKKKDRMKERQGKKQEEEFMNIGLGRRWRSYSI